MKPPMGRGRPKRMRGRSCSLFGSSSTPSTSGASGAAVGSTTCAYFVRFLRMSSRERGIVELMGFRVMGLRTTGDLPPLPGGFAHGHPIVRALYPAPQNFFCIRSASIFFPRLEALVRMVGVRGDPWSSVGWRSRRSDESRERSHRCSDRDTTRRKDMVRHRRVCLSPRAHARVSRTGRRGHQLAPNRRRARGFVRFRHRGGTAIHCG